MYLRNNQVKKKESESCSNHSWSKRSRETRKKSANAATCKIRAPLPALIASPLPPLTDVIIVGYLPSPLTEFEFQRVLPWKSPVSATTVVRSFSWLNELMVFVFFDWDSLIVAVGIYACARAEMKNFNVSIARVLRKHWYLIVSYAPLKRGDWLSDREFPEDRKIHISDAQSARSEKRSLSNEISAKP